AGVAVADFTVDGRLDIGATTPNGNVTKLFVNAGVPAFKELSFSPGGTSIAVADFDHDNRLDVAIALPQSGGAVLWGDPNALLAGALFVPGAVAPFSVVAP